MIAMITMTAMIISNLFQSKEEIEAKLKKKRDAIEAKERDSVRTTIVAENNGGTIAAKDADTVVQFCGTEKSYKANIASCQALIAFFISRKAIAAIDLKVREYEERVATLRRELTTAHQTTEAARIASIDAWRAGKRDIAVAFAQTDAKAVEMRIETELNYLTSVLAENQEQRKRMIDEQADMDCWVDATSEHAIPNNFALHCGPRERPTTARVEAASLAQDTADRRRRELRDTRKTDISALNATIEKLDVSVQEAQQKCDDAESAFGNQSGAFLSAVASVQALKNERKINRDRIAELQHQIQFG